VLALIAAIGVELEQKWLQTEQRRHHEGATVAILNIGAVNDGVHQEALDIDKDMATASGRAASAGLDQ